MAYSEKNRLDGWQNYADVYQQGYFYVLPYYYIVSLFKENGFFGNINKAESENESEQASDEVTDEEVHEPEENTADDIDSKQEEMSTESSDAKKTDSEKKDETSVADNKYAQMAEEKFGDIVNKADVQTSVDMQME